MYLWDEAEEDGAVAPGESGVVSKVNNIMNERRERARHGEGGKEKRER
jgi:hypothetical protein